MSLNNILDTIKQDAEKEIGEIKKDNDQQIEKMKDKYVSLLEEAKKKVLEETKLTVKKKIEQEKFKIKSEMNAQILQAKKQIMDEVFDRSVPTLASLGVDDQKSLLEFLIKSLPKVEDGKIKPTENSAKLIEGICSSIGSDFKVTKDRVDGEGGFIFVSPKLEVNNLYKTLTVLVRDDIETKVAEILFTQAPTGAGFTQAPTGAGFTQAPTGAGFTQAPKPLTKLKI